MHSSRCNKRQDQRRRRPSIILDAGYVSITSIHSPQSSQIFALDGTKLICGLCTVFILLLISFINLTCLLWLMHKLDWSLLNPRGSRLFRLNRTHPQVQVNQKVTFEEAIYTTKLTGQVQMDFSTEKAIDVYGEQNLVLLNSDQILLNTDHFYLKHNTSIDFRQLHLLKFDNDINTRVHLDRFDSEHIHHQTLNFSARNQLTISRVDHALFSSANLLLEANRHRRRSVLSFNSHHKTSLPFSDRRQKIPQGSFHGKSEAIFLDVPHLPFSKDNHRSEQPNTYQICICNATFLLFRSLAHQSCPFC